MKWLGSLLICAMPWLHEFLYCLFLPAIQIGINDNKRGATHRLAVAQPEIKIGGSSSLLYSHMSL